MKNFVVAKCFDFDLLLRKRSETATKPKRWLCIIPCEAIDRHQSKCLMVSYRVGTKSINIFQFYTYLLVKLSLFFSPWGGSYIIIVQQNRKKKINNNNKEDCRNK